MAQAENLTDAQIDGTYEHFEYGDAAPAGVKLGRSYTRTMGRHVDYDDDGNLVLVDYNNI